MIDAFRIGVQLTMQTNALGVLNQLSSGFLGLHKHISAAQSQLTGFKVALGGLASITIGTGILKGVWAAVEAGDKLLEQQGKLAMAGASQMEVAQATAAAWRVAYDVPGSRVEDAVQHIRELRAILGTTDAAIAAAPEAARTSAVLGHLTGQEGNAQLQTLFKALELRGGVIDPTTGQIDSSRLRLEENEALKTMNASGGIITPQMMMGLMQQAGPMARMMQPGAFWDTMMTAVMEMGGPRAGTAMTAAGRTLFGGVMPERNAREMAQLGLLAPGGYEVGRGGHIITHPGGLQGQDILNTQGLFQWTQQTLAPALHSAFLQQRGAHPEMTETQFSQQEMYRLFPTETMRRLMGIFLTQAEVVMRDQQLRQGAEGLGITGPTSIIASERRAQDTYGMTRQSAFDTMRDTSLTSNIEALHSAFHNLLVALGGPATKDAIFVIQRITGALQYLTDSAAAHPQAARIIVDVMAGLGTFLVVAGGVAIAGSALAFILSGGAAGALAAIVGGITALGVALMAVDWSKAWDGLVAGLRSLQSRIMDLFHVDPSKIPSGPAHRNGRTEDQSGRHSSIQLNLDGRRLAEIVIDHMGRAAGPLSGPGTFDPRRSYTPIEVG